MPTLQHLIGASRTVTITLGMADGGESTFTVTYDPTKFSRRWAETVGAMSNTVQAADVIVSWDVETADGEPWPLVCSTDVDPQSVLTPLINAGYAQEHVEAVAKLILEHDPKMRYTDAEKAAIPADRLVPAGSGPTLEDIPAATLHLLLEEVIHDGYQVARLRPTKRKSKEPATG